MSTGMIVYIIVSLLIILAVTLVYFLVLNPKNKEGNVPKANKVKLTTKINFRMQRFYKLFPVTRSLYSRTANRLQTLYPTDIITINKRTTILLNKVLLIALTITLFGIFTGDGNPIYIGGCAVIAYVCVSLTIDVYLEGLERQLIKDFRNILPKIGKNYDKCKIVNDAIYTTYLGISNETSYSEKKKKVRQSKNMLIGLHLQKIYDVLSQPSSKIDVATQEYISTSPNQYLTMFLSICLSIRKKGDNGIRTNNGSTFKKNIYDLQELLNEEVINTEDLYQKMKSIPFITLMPLLLVKPFIWFSKYILAEAGDVFEGSYGVVMVAVAFGISIVCYELVMRIKEPHKAGSQNTADNIWHKLCYSKFFAPLNRFIDKWILRHYARTQKIMKKLKKAANRIGAKEFIFQKLFYLVGGFLISMTLCISGVIMDRINKIPNYTESFEEQLVPNDQYRETMRETAEEVSRMYGKEINDPETLTELVMQNPRIYNTLYAEAIANEIIRQQEDYNSTKFYWWHILISIFVALGFYEIPNLLLYTQLKMAETTKEDEVNQFRAIVSLLIDTGSTTVDEILYNMQRFAKYYKEPISKCIINIDRNETKALEELKLSEITDDSFVDIVDGLLNVKHAGVVKSFETIKADKEYYRKNRASEVKRINDGKIAKGQLIWSIPFFATLLMTIGIPLTVYAFSMIQQVGF